MDIFTQKQQSTTAFALKYVKSPGVHIRCFHFGNNLCLFCKTFFLLPLFVVVDTFYFLRMVWTMAPTAKRKKKEEKMIPEATLDSILV